MHENELYRIIETYVFADVPDDITTIEKMTPYIILFTFIVLTQLLYGWVCVRGNAVKIRKWDNQLFFWYSLLVCLMMGTRLQTVGTDTENYVRFFHHPMFYYHGGPTDWGFEQLGRFFHLFDGSTEWFILWSSLLSMAGVLYLIKKYSHHKSTSMMLFVIGGTTFIMFQMYLNAIRQACALSFYLFAVCLLFADKRRRGHLVGAVVLFAAAYLIHGSTLFGVPFVLIAYFAPLRNKVAWYVLIWTFYILAVLNISFVNTILDAVFDVLGRNKYEGYADVTFGEVEYTGSNTNMLLLPYSLLMTAVTYLSSKDMLRQWWVQLSLMGAVLTNLFYNNLMWGRLLLPLVLISIVAVPNVLGGGKKYLRLPLYFVTVAYFLYKNINGLAGSLIHGYVNRINTTVPYESWLINFFN